MSSLQLLSVFNININFLLGGSGAVVKVKIKNVSSIVVNRDMFVLNASANAIRLGLLGGVKATSQPSLSLSLGRLRLRPSEPKESGLSVFLRCTCECDRDRGSGDSERDRDRWLVGCVCVCVDS